MKTLHPSETLEDINPSTNGHISEDVSSQYMNILGQNSLHSAQPFCYILQYPKAMFCVICRDFCYKSEFVGAWVLTLSPVDQCRQTWMREWAPRGPPSTLPLSTASKLLCLEMQPLLTHLQIIRLQFLSSTFFPICCSLSCSLNTLYILSH